MRRIALIFIGFLALLPLAGHARAADFTDAQKADLKRVETYMNGLSSLKGHFLQVGPDGSSDQGTFYFRKPGRMRFEFDKAGDGKNGGNLVISDGTTVAIVNPALKTTNRYPLLDSPLALLSSDAIDLTNDKRVVAVDREPGTISVTARQANGAAQGQITLTFIDAGNLELRQWEIVDAQRLHTVVVLSDVATGVDIPAKQFVIPDLNPFQRH